MQVFPSMVTGVGVAQVMQPLPNQGLRQISPFLLLHHIGPNIVSPGQDALGVGSHPHRGFEPVTFLFEGGLEHKDSMGNIGHLKSGDVQWMTAGSGVLHSEHSHPEFKKTGGAFHMVQLWVNLPKEFKMADPRYQDIKSDEIPKFSLGTNGSYGRVIAGMYDHHNGPAETFTPINALHIIAAQKDEFNISLEPGFNTFIYMLKGDIASSGNQLVQHQLAIPSTNVPEIDFVIHEPSEFLILSGQPINEPMASYGPFVMNSQTELQEAIRDFQMGKMGTLQ